MLDFVESNRRIQTGNEAVWVTFGGSEDAGVVESEVTTVRLVQFRRLDECCFSRLAGSVDQNGRCIGESLREMTDKMARNHASIISHEVDDNQPHNGRLSSIIGNLLDRVVDPPRHRLCIGQNLGA